MRYLATLLLLASCGTAGLVWREADINGQVNGALNIGGDRPLIQERCGTPRFMSPTNAPVCAYAFVDSNGKRVDIFDLRDRLDAYAQGRPEFLPWINKSGDRKDERLFPYNMYLLTISPAVVLVVPRSRPEEHKSCGFLLRTGCIQSQAFPGNSFWFRGSPKIQENAFWVNVDAGTEPSPIPSTTGTVNIATGGALIRLLPSRDEWTVLRVR